MIDAEVPARKAWEIGHSVYPVFSILPPISTTSFDFSSAGFAAHEMAKEKGPAIGTRAVPTLAQWNAPHPPIQALAMPTFQQSQNLSKGEAMVPFSSPNFPLQPQTY